MSEEKPEERGGAENTPRPGPGTSVEDGSEKGLSGETRPETIADLREAVDQKIDDLFGGIGDDDEMPDADTGQAPEATPPLPAAELRDLSRQPRTKIPAAAATTDVGKIHTTAAPADKKKAAPAGRTAAPAPTPESTAAKKVDTSPPPKPVKKKVESPQVKSTANRHLERQKPPQVKKPAPALPLKGRPSQMGRILVWGAVLGVVVFTALYFKTRQSQEPAAPTAENGVLFHKIVPSTPLIETKPAASPSAAATAAPRAPAPEKPAPSVPPYVERAYPYAIHMASFRDPDLARENATEYGRAFKAFIVRVDLGEKGIWYRLHFGHFPDALSAEDAVRKYQLKDAVVGHIRYACLVGSHASAEAAAGASRRLSDKGFFPYTIVLGEGHYVFVGGNPSKSVVEGTSDKLKKEGFPNKVIKR